MAKRLMITMYDLKVNDKELVSLIERLSFRLYLM